MRYIKTYESKANIFRNEKLKENKKKVSKILLSEKIVKELIKKVFEDENYISFCEDNIIDPINFDDKMQNSFSVKDNDKYTHSLNRTFNSNDKLYKNNYTGLCKLVNDYYQEDSIEFNINDNSELVKAVYSIGQRLSLMLNINEEMCSVYIYYELEWAGKNYPITINSNFPDKKISRSDLNTSELTKQQILDFFKIEIEKFKVELLKKLNNFQKEIKETIEGIKSLIKTFGTSDITKGAILAHFPFLIHLLDLNQEDFKGSKDLKGMGFDD
jgi:hypothetical protein